MQSHPFYPMNIHRTNSLLHRPEPIRIVKETYQNPSCPAIYDLELLSSAKKQCVYKSGSTIYKFRQADE
jgi:hypothetical protein